MKKLILLILFFVGCDSSADLTSTETSWLSSVSSTSWEYDNQTLEFNSSGETITTQNDDNYDYAFSTSSTSGVYTTAIEFPPTEWYLFVLSGDTLIQYGGFLESNLISQDDDSKITFTK